ncbi:MAG: dihydropteroate synthase [Verrucomicrobiota bacterium]
MIWKTRDHAFDLSSRALIMGIVNVTPDSFSDGGRFFQVESAVRQGCALVEEGADILDIGGESTRPGAAEVSEEEEIRRILPVLEQLREKTRVALSIDTSKSRVARAAIDAGASIINDVTGLGDPAMAEVAASTGAGLVLMHMQGTPRTMQKAPVYNDVVGHVRESLEERRDRALTAGVPVDRLAFDPGIGFGKTVQHNLQLLKALPDLVIDDQPILLGVSRKSFIGKTLGDEAIEKRLWPTVGLTAYAIEKGVRILRVHDVRANVEAARMMEAILGTTG